MQNSFESSASEYLDLSVTTGGAILRTTKAIVSYNATDDSISVGMGTIGDAAVIDFNTTGGTAGQFDSRIVSFAAAGPGQANNFAFQTSGNIQLLAPTQIGSPTSPPFKVDFATTLAAAGVNQITTINFTADLFTGPPTVVCTANTPTGSSGDQITHVEEVTASSFKVEYLGVAAAGTYINWIALGV